MSGGHREATTEAYCWLIQRPDGAGLSVTSHDEEVTCEGISCEPNIALRVDRLRITDQLGGGELRLSGALSSSGFSVDDLAQGRWSDSTLRLLRSDWGSAAATTMLCHGDLSAIHVQGENAEVEVSLSPQRLRDQASVQTSPECRAVLGDRHCRISMRSRHRRIVVTAVNDAQLTVDLQSTEPFGFGHLRWLSGSNCGLDDYVVATAPYKLELRERPRGAIKPGDRALLTEGCDGRRSTCSTRFSNIANFRGEPDLPGTDILMRYPGV